MGISLVQNLEELTAFLTESIEEIHFQAKAKATNGDEIELAACTGQKRGSKRCATTAGKGRLQISDSIPVSSAGNRHTLVTPVQLEHV